ncbi:hypothetical protein [Rhodococcus sp. USK13]|uniref:hypothetical protein n=1 Tax=Rhodococcus sp. USK13 TaxID=2806442 RepID=UPI0032D58FC3
MRVTAARIAEMPYHFAGRQRVFETIGPCTRAGFFTRNGELLTIKQDVGHRNAVGKLIRWATERNRVPLGHRAEPSPAGPPSGTESRCGGAFCSSVGGCRSSRCRKR